MSATHAFIAFLKCEAINAEERAKSLRATAAAIEANDASRNKKRKRDGPKQKRGPTGYTLFFQESYESFKKAHGENTQNSQDVLMMIARQWNDIAEEEREAWQYKAEQLKQANAAQASLAEMPLLSEAMEEDILREHMPPDPAEQEEHWASKKRASRQPAQKVTNV